MTIGFYTEQQLGVKFGKNQTQEKIMVIPYSGRNCPSLR
jgi:hypothetical protein